MFVYALILDAARLGPCTPAPLGWLYTVKAVTSCLLQFSLCLVVVYSALAAAQSVQHITIFEYVKGMETGSKGTPQLTQAMTSFTMDSQPAVPPSNNEPQPSNDSCSSSSARAAHAASWLPALVATYRQKHSLSGLSLLLLAPLPSHCQPLLLQLTSLASLQLAGSPGRLHTTTTTMSHEVALLLPAVVAQLTALNGLRSLTARLSVKDHRGHFPQVRKTACCA